MKEIISKAKLMEKEPSLFPPGTNTLENGKKTFKMGMAYRLGKTTVSTRES